MIVCPKAVRLEYTLVGLFSGMLCKYDCRDQARNVDIVEHEFGSNQVNIHQNAIVGQQLLALTLISEITFPKFGFRDSQSIFFHCFKFWRHSKLLTANKA